MLLTLFSFNGVKAEENVCEGLSLDKKPSLSMFEVLNEDIVSIFDEVFPDRETTYYQMRLDGYDALCISQGDSAHRKDIYTYERETTSADANYNMAYGFYTEGIYSGSQVTRWAIAQLVAWNGMDYETIKKFIRYDFAVDLIEKETVEDKTISELNRFADETYYIWKNETDPDGQRMITSLETCPEPVESTCPKGKMLKTEPELKCGVSKGGNLFTYSNEAISGNDATVSVSNYAPGVETYHIGTYCKLYCEEYGIATLPGAIGESLQLGSFIIWPTSKENSNSKFYPDAFPLKIKGELHCSIGIVPDSNLPKGCYDNPIYGTATKDGYLQIKSSLTDTTKDVYATKHTYQRNAGAGIANLEQLRLSITTWGSGETIPTVTQVEYKCKAVYKDPSKAISEEFTYDAAEEALNLAIQNREAVNPKKMDVICSDGTPGCQDWTPEYKQKQAIVDEKEKAFNAIKDAINDCVTYTRKFETARQILKEYKTCAEYIGNTALYNFNSKVKFNYADKQYNTGDVVKTKTNETLEWNPAYEPRQKLFEDKIKENDLKVSDLYSVTELNSKVNQIRKRELTIVKEDEYSLSTGYKYINKETKSYLKTRPSTNNYSTIKTSLGVIPTSYDNEIAKNYWLILSEIEFGNAKFGGGSEYKCPVQFTKASNTTCVCPEGTLMEGMDLIGKIKDEGITCADAQLKYCDSEFEEEPAPYCDAPYEHISLVPCINAGHTAEECKTMPGICNTYKCQNTNNSAFENMDITSCVQTKIAEGLSIEQAKDYCDKVVCPLGKTIIYRTIRLENPFPSYDPSNTLYRGLSTGMFNNNTKGRYPGANWNGILTVYNKIRNNRSGRLETNETNAKNASTTIGTKIYQTKEPLYTFVLNGDTIKEIREYNENITDGYNDFNNMDCKINNSTACVSTLFVHEPNGKYGLVSGECLNNTASNNFYKCAGR